MPRHHIQPGTASRRDLLRAAVTTTVGLGLATPSTRASEPEPEATDSPGTHGVAPEWRNRHPEMAYRMLGRTGYMISEVVYGGYLIKPDLVGLYEAALERGLNYLDQAASYGNGEGERAIATLLKRGIPRDRFFLTTKLSHYNGFVRQRYAEAFKGLPEARQQAVQELADRLLHESGNTRPGYHVHYFDGQESPLVGTYRVTAMKQLGIRVADKRRFRDKINELFEQSLRRAGVEHFDVLFCPHSVEAPASFDDEAMIEGLADLKGKGAARALAFSAHNDTGANLRAGVSTGRYDAAMVAYNIVNHLAMDPAIEEAAAAGVGVIAMKVARPVIVDPLEWRLAKLNTLIRDPELSPAQKAYLFALQNPNLSAVISDMGDITMLSENLDLAGRKTTVHPV